MVLSPFALWGMIPRFLIRLAADFIRMDADRSCGKAFDQCAGQDDLAGFVFSTAYSGHALQNQLGSCLANVPHRLGNDGQARFENLGHTQAVKSDPGQILRNAQPPFIDDQASGECCFIICGENRGRPVRLVEQCAEGCQAPAIW